MSGGKESMEVESGVLLKLNNEGGAELPRTRGQTRTRTLVAGVYDSDQN